MKIHASYIATGSSSLHQKLVFPYVWVSINYRMNVPSPPQSGLLPEGVIARKHHKMIMVW